MPCLCHRRVIGWGMRGMMGEGVIMMLLIKEIKEIPNILHVCRRTKMETMEHRRYVGMIPYRSFRVTGAKSKCRDDNLRVACAPTYIENLAARKIYV